MPTYELTFDEVSLIQILIENKIEILENESEEENDDLKIALEVQRKLRGEKL